MKQILNWIGKDKLKTFDGVIVFDECHRAKHVLLGKDGGTKTASAVIELQDALPNARIVYVVLYKFFFSKSQFMHTSIHQHHHHQQQTDTAPQRVSPIRTT